jgi:hypothetical protein
MSPRGASLAQAARVAEEQDGPAHDQLCDELLDYMRDHPNAMDTLEGIAGWWVPRHRVPVELERVAHALRTLEARELIERAGNAERPLFRVRRTR